MGFFDLRVVQQFAVGRRHIALGTMSASLVNACVEGSRNASTENYLSLGSASVSLGSPVLGINGVLQLIQQRFFRSHVFGVTKRGVNLPSRCFDFAFRYKTPREVSIQFGDS